MFCPSCQRDLPETNFPACGVSTRELADGKIVKYQYREEICRKCRRAQRLAEGLCRCGQKLANDRSACERCLRASRESTNARTRADRLKALEHYGPDCAFCGESLEIFLTIDHINNDGASHRRSVRAKGKNQSGINIGAWLRKNGYPPGFQVLCVNCNHAKWRVGEEALKRILAEAGRLITSPIPATGDSPNPGD